MSLNASRSDQSSEYWGVVIQSVPSKSKKNIVKQLEQIFHLDKRDAEQVLANMPLILIDNLSFGLAVRVKKHFLDLGAVSETTNHDMIKKNCFEVVWPQTPDLSFFLKEEARDAKPAEGASPEKTATAKPAGTPPVENAPAPKSFLEIPVPEKKSVAETPAQVPPPKEKPSFVMPPAPISSEKQPLADESLDVPPAVDSPFSAKVEEKQFSEEKPADVQRAVSKPVFETPVENTDAPRILEDVLADPLPADEPVKEPPKTPVESEMPRPSAIDSDWERRAKELNEKLRWIQDEKRQLRDQHVEDTEKVKSELQERIAQEKQKSDDIAKALEELKKKTERHEELSKEGDEWRAQAVALGEKVRVLEEELTQKNTSLEALLREKQEMAGSLGRAQESLSDTESKLDAVTRDLSAAREREGELSRKFTEFHSSIDAKDGELVTLRSHVTELEGKLSEIENEASSLRKAEQGHQETVRALERSVQEKTDALKLRDEGLARFERQVLELAGKVAEYETMRREHAQFVQERASLHKEYEAKLSEQEVRLAKVEDEHRRYRSRTDRKNAAATRELGESVRVVDTVRQGLQKLILFLGSEAAVLDTEKKVALKSPLTRGPSSPNPDKS